MRASQIDFFHDFSKVAVLSMSRKLVFILVTFLEYAHKLVEPG